MKEECCAECGSLNLEITRERDVFVYGPERFRISYMAKFRNCKDCGIRYMNWDSQKQRIKAIEEFIKNRRKRGTK